MPASYHFSRASVEATEMTLHDGNGLRYATLRYPPDAPVTLQWVDPNLPEQQFPDLDAAKQWIADHADAIFGG